MAPRGVDGVLCYLMLFEDEADKARFRWIYDRLRHRMYRVALSLLHSDSKAQEAVQESFFKIIRNFSKINQLSSQEIVPYIVTIVENTAKDILRKENRQGGDFPEEWELPGPDATQEETAYRRLVALVAAMPEQYRDVLLLKFVEEETDAAIARRLGLSLTQVSGRVSRGRKLLQERLREEGYEYDG